MLLKTIKFLLLTAIIGVVVFLINLIWFRPIFIDHFYNKVMVCYLLEDPETITMAGVPYLNDWYKDELTDVSEKHKAALRKKTETYLTTLRSYSKKWQSPEQLLNTKILETFLSDLVEGHQFPYHDYPVNQFNGIQSTLPSFLDSYHKVEKPSDAKAYISRLSKFDTKFDQVIESLQIREEKNILPPKFVIEKVLKQIREFIAPPTEQNLLYTSFKHKLEHAKQDLNTEKYLKQAKAELESTVFPAYRKLIAQLGQMQLKATNDAGVWKLPRGYEFYSYLLKHYTTVDIKPEEVHELGLLEVARIQSQMRALLASRGYTNQSKSVSRYLRQIAREKRFVYPEKEESKEQCLKDFQNIIASIESKLDDIFEIRPQAPLEVKRVPPFKEKSSAFAYYEPPSLDGKRGGIFYIRLDALNELPKFDMPTLAIHEGIPGHHFQLAIQSELKGLPLFRNLIPFTAYVEGWAMYTEQLVWEEGYYDGDPYGNLGRLKSELFRAVRLVVDSGIHYKRWSREHAIAYMKANTGMGQKEIEAEVERYIVLPGQACAYTIGMQKILELRQKARQALGEQFKIKKFHSVVLQNGSLPLEVLEQLVEKYISETKKADTLVVK
ncbi:MAG: DUF885 family protein [Marinifilaceae bacterium]